MIKRIGNYTINHIDEAEYINPIEFDFNNRLDSRLATIQSIINIHPELKDMPEHTSRKVGHRMAVKEHLKSWKEDYEEIMAVEFPENYFDFLLSTKRKVQNKILEPHKLDVNSMQAIFYRAWNEYGFTFSTYRFEKMPKNLEGKKFPELYYLQPDNTFDIIGETDLTEGQLRAALNQRSVVLAKFLDKGRHWHCFLHTYNSIMGKEKGNMPHLHYISSAFGTHITREGVLDELRKGKYELPSMIHIPYDESRMNGFPEVPIIAKIIT